MTRRHRAERQAQRRTLVFARRALVAELRLRHALSVRRIQAAMRQNPGLPGALNLKGRVWNHQTIQEDIQYLDGEWRKKATDLRKGRILAELSMVRSSAWQSNDLAGVLAVINREVAIWGLAAPKRARGPGGPTLEQLVREARQDGTAHP